LLASQYGIVSTKSTRQQKSRLASAFLSVAKQASLFVINLGGFFLALAFFLCGHDETPEVVLEGCNVQVANEVYVKYLLV